MSLVTNATCYGSETWEHAFPTTATDDDVAPGREQKLTFRARHVTHVYFNDLAPYAYYVIDATTVQATPGDAPAKNDDDNARGFFNSSIYVGYKAAYVSDGCSITRLTDAPNGSVDNFNIDFRGESFRLMIETTHGSDPDNFQPTYTGPQVIAPSWSLVRADVPDAWIAHQREPWNAYGVDGPTGSDVPTKWIDSLFNYSPFGKIVKFPETSFQSQVFEIVKMWQIDGNFKPDAREATLALDMDYSHRANLFVNGTKTAGKKPKRGYVTPRWTPPTKKLDLKAIAKRR